MAKINYEIRCPGCGKSIQGRRNEDEIQRSFQCSKCTTKWKITWKTPSRDELEAAFMLDEIPPGPTTKAHRAEKGGFPFKLPKLRAARPTRKPIFKRKKQ